MSRFSKIVLARSKIFVLESYSLPYERWETNDKYGPKKCSQWEKFNLETHKNVTMLFLP